MKFMRHCPKSASFEEMCKGVAFYLWSLQSFCKGVSWRAFCMGFCNSKNLEVCPKTKNICTDLFWWVRPAFQTVVSSYSHTAHILRKDDCETLSCGDHYFSFSSFPFNPSCSVVSSITGLLTNLEMLTLHGGPLQKRLAM